MGLSRPVLQGSGHAPSKDPLISSLSLREINSSAAGQRLRAVVHASPPQAPSIDRPPFQGSRKRECVGRRWDPNAFKGLRNSLHRVKYSA
ncbi:hypothetical protein P7K49_011902, partial [Saguinus oedipus]